MHFQLNVSSNETKTLNSPHGTVVLKLGNEVVVDVSKELEIPLVTSVVTVCGNVAVPLGPMLVVRTVVNTA